MQTARSFVGMDVLKETISISVAEDGRNGPVRFLGVIPNAADDVAKMAKRLSKHGELDFCHEASGWGCGIAAPSPHTVQYVSAYYDGRHTQVAPLTNEVSRKNRSAECRSHDIRR